MALGIDGCPLVGEDPLTSACTSLVGMVIARSAWPVLSLVRPVRACPWLGSSAGSLAKYCGETQTDAGVVLWSAQPFGLEDARNA